MTLLICTGCRKETRIDAKTWNNDDWQCKHCEKLHLYDKNYYARKAFRSSAFMSNLIRRPLNQISHSLPSNKTTQPGRLLCENCGLEYNAADRCPLCNYISSAQDVKTAPPSVRLDCCPSGEATTGDCGDLLVYPGKYYKHFKGGLYKVLSVAKDSETGRLMVVYQAMYGDRGVWVRPYNMFIESVPAAMPSAVCMSGEVAWVPRFQMVDTDTQIKITQTSNHGHGMNCDLRELMPWMCETCYGRSCCVKWDVTPPNSRY